MLEKKDMTAFATKRPAHIDDALLLVGQTLSQVSDRMVQLGLIWFITSTFGESYLIWYLVIGGLPHALLVSHSSLVIEKLTALKTVLYSDMARGIVYFIAFLLLFLLPELLLKAGGSSILLLLFVSIFSANIFSALFNPAIMSLSVEIKKNDQVQKLTAMLSSITSFATIIGPVLGLFVFNHFGLAGLFAISSLSYFISTFSLSQVSKPQKHAIPESDAEGLTKSFSPFGTHIIIGVMLTVFLLMNFLLSPLQILMPSMAKETFGNSFNALAVLETVLGSGILLGGAVLTVVSIKHRPLFWTWFFSLILSLAYLFFTLSSHITSNEISIFGASYKISLLLASGALFVLGFCLGIANVLIINILQTQPSPQHVPKVMSLVNLIGTATLPFSLAFLGLLQSLTSIGVLGIAAGAFLVLVSSFSFFPFRKFGQEVFK